MTLQTLDAAMSYAGSECDVAIDRHLQAYEASIRHHLVMSGPEDEDALDRPPNPESPWRMSTIEECLMLERERLHVWRAETLARLRLTFADLYLSARAHGAVIDTPSR